MTVRVLGVDPGTAVTGYGVVESAGNGAGRLIECGIVRTNPADKLWRRLDALYDGVAEVIDRHDPMALAVENVFCGRNVQTTLVLGHARGVILLAAARAGMDVAEFAPATVKKVLAGGGAAAKGQVAYMVGKLLNLRCPPQPPDAADGVAVALAYLLAHPQS